MHGAFVLRKHSTIDTPSLYQYKHGYEPHPSYLWDTDDARDDRLQRSSHFHRADGHTLRDEYARSTPHADRNSDPAPRPTYHTVDAHSGGRTGSVLR